jgi:hypothetical protein
MAGKQCRLDRTAAKRQLIHGNPNLTAGTRKIFVWTAMTGHLRKGRQEIDEHAKNGATERSYGSAMTGRQ